MTRSAQTKAMHWEHQSWARHLVTSFGSIQVRQKGQENDQEPGKARTKSQRSAEGEVVVELVEPAEVVVKLLRYSKKRQGKARHGRSEDKERSIYLDIEEQK
jgi:hypothetical protein